jgi:K+ transport systems, NAD-binding component
MRVAIAGAGAVGRSIAKELLENGHEVLLIDKSPRAIKVYRVPGAEWLLADACEISSLDDASLERCNVVIAATGTTRPTWSCRCWPRPSTGCRASWRG